MTDLLTLIDNRAHAHDAAAADETADVLRLLFAAAASADDVPRLSGALRAVLATCAKVAGTYQTRRDTGDDRDDRADATNTLAEEIVDAVTLALASAAIPSGQR